MNDLTILNANIEDINNSLDFWINSNVSSKSCYINISWKDSLGNFIITDNIPNNIKDIIIRTNKSTDMVVKEIFGNSYKLKFSSELF